MQINMDNEKILKLLVTFFVFFAVYATPVLTRADDCESNQSIIQIFDDGKIVKLDDGSIWEVSAYDTVDSALWMAGDDVVTCDDKLINTDENESVDATQIR